MTDPSWETLEPRARWVFHLTELLEYFFVVVPGALAFAFFGSGVMPWTWAAGIAGVGAVAGLLWAVWSPSAAWGGWSFLLREHDLLIASGVLVREIVAIPYHRIQHVDVTQGPVERAFGLSRVVVYTGTGAGADGLIPGLSPERADALRDRLIRGVADDGV